MLTLVSWYSHLICPLSPLARSLIIAVLVVLAIVHVRVMYAVAAWLAGTGSHPRFALALLIAAHVDAGIVAGLAVLHAAAEASCPSPPPWPALRAVLPLTGAAAMIYFAWAIFWPRLREGCFRR